MKFTEETARVMGRRGGQHRRALSVARVERELGPLKTIDDAQRRLDRVMIWGAGGMLAGAVAGAVVRAAEVWVKAEEARNSFEEVERLRDAVRSLAAHRDQLAADLEHARALLEQRKAK
jgi:hypothetical protein